MELGEEQRGLPNEGSNLVIERLFMNITWDDLCKVTMCLCHLSMPSQSAAAIAYLTKATMLLTRVAFRKRLETRRPPHPHSDGCSGEWEGRQMGSHLIELFIRQSSGEHMPDIAPRSASLPLMHLSFSIQQDGDGDTYEERRHFGWREWCSWCLHLS